MKIILPAISALLLAGVAHAEPPSHAKGESLPPGLQKQGKVPPGHAKKIWNSGEFLPMQYRDYRVEDWRRYDLDEPRDGYRWVRVDNEAYLVNATSGLIAEAIIDAFN